MIEMKKAERYLFAEFFLTLLLLELVFFLYGEILGANGLYLSLGLICGFGFSWLMRDRKIQAPKILSAIGVIGCGIWLFRSIATSSFFYREVILLTVKAGFFLAVVLSFDACRASVLSVMRALNLALFLCFPILIKEQNESSVILSLLYFLLWMAVLKIHYRDFLHLENVRQPGAYYIFSISLLIFLVSLAATVVLFRRFEGARIEMGGLLFVDEKRMGMSAEEESALEREYYDLQDRILKELTESFEGKRAKSKVFYFLSQLVKETSSAKEVKEAEVGLVDFLNRPGPGFEDWNTEDITITLKSYIDKKVALNMIRDERGIREQLKPSRFSLKEKRNIMEQVRQIQSCRSAPDLARYETKTEDIVDNSRAKTAEKQEIKELIKHMAEFKVFQLERDRATVADAGDVANQPDMSRIKDMPFADAQAPALSMPAEMSEITQVPAAIGESLRTSGGIQDKRIARRFPGGGTGAAGRSADIIAKAAVFLCVCLMFFLAVCHVITRVKMARLKACLRRSPKEFLIRLYENLKGILTIYGLKGCEFLPPLSYAEAVADKYSIKSDLFLRFTAKFEEAKYSRHLIRSQEALLQIDDYNRLLKMLFSRESKPSLFFKYGLALCNRRPLFISRS